MHAKKKVNNLSCHVCMKYHRYKMIYLELKRGHAAHCHFWAPRAPIQWLCKTCDVQHNSSSFIHSCSIILLALTSLNYSNTNSILWLKACKLLVSSFFYVVGRSNYLWNHKCSSRRKRTNSPRSIHMRCLICIVSIISWVHIHYQGC